MGKFKVGDLVKGVSGNFEDEIFPDEFMTVEITDVMENEYSGRLIMDELDREDIYEDDFYYGDVELSPLSPQVESLGVKIAPLNISSIYGADTIQNLILLGEIK